MGVLTRLRRRTLFSRAPGEQLRRQFEQRYRTKPRLVRAPGRVNLIGEHTDYNDGYVMPVAINLSTYIAAAPRSDGLLVLRSHNFEELVELPLEDARPRRHWSDYVVGVALELRRSGVPVPGARLLIRGDVPLAAGLSSSASLEVATALALSLVAKRSLDRTELARLCRRAEHEFVGAHCGIMDQFVSAHGRAGHAVLLDCRSLEFRLLPLPAGVSLVICNSMVRHSIAGGEYNQRRAECEAAAKALGVPALRDINPEDFERRAAELPEPLRRRARHVVTENARVLAAAAALEAGDLTKLGRLMADSHRSLRDDYEVSCAELDVLVEAARGAPGVIGARMTGGGFGGCTVNLVRDDAVVRFRKHVTQQYKLATHVTPEIYVCAAADGAQEL